MGTTINPKITGTSNLSYDSSGNLVANVIPRTGTLASLVGVSGIDGGVGEIASATDVPAVAKLNGVATQGVQITSCDNVLVITSASATVTTTVKPDANKLYFTASCVYTLTLSNGYFVGQRISIEADTDTATEVDITLVDGAVTLGNISSTTYGNVIEVQWNGAGWKYVSGTATRGGNFSESLAGAASPFSAEAVAVGRGVVAVSKDKGFVVCTNPTNTNVDANNIAEVKIGFGNKSASGLAELYAAGAAGTFELTTDGAAGSASNRIAFQAGMIYRCRLVVNARIATLNTTTTYWSGIRDFVVCVNNLGTAITVSSVNTLGTDLSTVTGTAPSLAIAGSSGKLTVNFTHGHSASLNVRASLEVLGSYGG